MALIEEYKDAERQMMRSFGSGFLYTFLSSVCVLAMPIFMFQVFDRVLKSRSVETLIAMMLFAIIVLIAYGIFDSVRQRLLARAAISLETKMAGLLLAGEMSRQSDATAQSLRDLTAIRSVVASPAMSALFELPMMPFFVTIIFIIHTTLGFVVLVGAAIVLSLGLWSDRATAKQNSEYSQAMMESNKSLDGHLNSQELIRSHGLYREAVSEWGDKHSHALAMYLDSTSKSTNFSSMSKAVRQIIQVLMIASGAMLVLFDEASGGVIFASAMIGSRALSPVEQIVGSWRALKAGWETRTRLMQRLRELEVPTDRTPLPVPKGSITLKGLVYVSRPGTPPLVRAASAAIEAGDSVAIIGPSGAGKSTLARLIVGYLRPTAGSVLLDGQDIHSWDPTARGLHMGYMPQSVTFFQGKTVGQNIARLRVDDPPELIIEAAKRAGVHDLMMRLPQGYDTVISPREFTPSGGQAQLIALARALYGAPKVVVLDEPNAALDQEGEAIFHKALDRANKEGRTMIVVTQRPVVLKHVNKVMLMANARIKEYGDKEEVMGSGNVGTKAATPNIGHAAQAARQARKAQKAQGKEADTGSANAKTVAESKKKAPAKSKVEVGSALKEQIAQKQDTEAQKTVGVKKSNG